MTLRNFKRPLPTERPLVKRILAWIAFKSGLFLPDRYARFWQMDYISIKRRHLMYTSIHTRDKSTNLLNRDLSSQNGQAPPAPAPAFIIILSRSMKRETTNTSAPAVIPKMIPQSTLVESIAKSTSARILISKLRINNEICQGHNRAK